MGCRKLTLLTSFFTIALHRCFSVYVKSFKLLNSGLMSVIWVLCLWCELSLLLTTSSRLETVPPSEQSGVLQVGKEKSMAKGTFPKPLSEVRRTRGIPLRVRLISLSSTLWSSIHLVTGTTDRLLCVSTRVDSRPLVYCSSELSPSFDAKTFAQDQVSFLKLECLINTNFYISIVIDVGG